MARMAWRDLYRLKGNVTWHAEYELSNSPVRVHHVCLCWHYQYLWNDWLWLTVKWKMNNRRITIERNSVFWKQWFDRGVITFISDLMNSNGKFLTFEEFQNRFEIKANYLHYFQLIAAILPDLKRKAFGSTVPDLLEAINCQFYLIQWEDIRCNLLTAIILTGI